MNDNRPSIIFNQSSGAVGSTDLSAAVLNPSDDAAESERPIKYRRPNTNTPPNTLSLPMIEGDLLDKARMIVVIDTNYFLDNLPLIMSLATIALTRELVIVVPWIVIQELDGLKSCKRMSTRPNRPLQEVSTLARSANRYLDDALGRQGNALRCQRRSEYLRNETINDDKILDCCLYFIEKCKLPVAILTQDRSLNVKARANGCATCGDWAMDAQGLLNIIENSLLKSDDAVQVLPPESSVYRGVAAAGAARAPPLMAKVAGKLRKIARAHPYKVPRKHQQKGSLVTIPTTHCIPWDMTTNGNDNDPDIMEQSRSKKARVSPSSPHLTMQLRSSATHQQHQQWQLQRQSKNKNKIQQQNQSYGIVRPVAFQAIQNNLFGNQASAFEHPVSSQMAGPMTNALAHDNRNICHAHSGLGLFNISLLQQQQLQQQKLQQQQPIVIEDSDDEMDVDEIEIVHSTTRPASTETSLRSAPVPGLASLKRTLPGLGTASTLQSPIPGLTLLTSSTSVLPQKQTQRTLPGLATAAVPRTPVPGLTPGISSTVAQPQPQMQTQDQRTPIPNNTRGNSDTPVIIYLDDSPNKEIGLVNTALDISVEIVRYMRSRTGCGLYEVLLGQLKKKLQPQPTYAESWSDVLQRKFLQPPWKSTTTILTVILCYWGSISQAFHKRDHNAIRRVLPWVMKLEGVAVCPFTSQSLPPNLSFQQLPISLRSTQPEDMNRQIEETVQLVQLANSLLTQCALVENKQQENQRHHFYNKWSQWLKDNS
ncbi:PIN domain-containing protein [Kickxella alabastrina]|uniref:PIN domain-containing protein n=1 Tax=Kickxella alabastrina TaxID=61397 RepID=UPI0022200642|nr:PIN domain-containing protein [Kickxella alabastrina]KAI7825889.1 PIN domain-containing protein [Kickxella alabastrina]KAJ1947259.1 hypothetical protein GGF37_000561 [Kickxella alabastrina]